MKNIKFSGPGRIFKEVIEFVSMDNININLPFKFNCWIIENNLQ